MTAVQKPVTTQDTDQFFENLIHKYGRRLYSVALRILRDPADAEDAVQEAYLKAYKAIDSFRGESSVYTWLYRIVSNQALMKVRKRQRKPTASIEDYLPVFEAGQHRKQVADWSHLPDAVLETQELRDFFEQCIDELPDDYRLAYILKDIEGLSEKDVSRITGTTRAAMKNRVHRARLILRGRIEERFFATS